MKRLLALICVSLTACQSVPNAPVSPSAPNVERDGLSPRNLADGQCGLFVWQADTQRRFIYFASADEAAFYDGTEVAVPVGDPPLAPRQNFTTNGRDWQLSLSQPSPMGDGIRYQAGSLRTEDEGWEKIIPVVGLATCLG